MKIYLSIFAVLFLFSCQQNADQDRPSETATSPGVTSNGETRMGPSSELGQYIFSFEKISTSNISLLGIWSNDANGDAEERIWIQKNKIIHSKKCTTMSGATLFAAAESELLVKGDKLIVLESKKYVAQTSDLKYECSVSVSADEIEFHFQKITKTLVLTPGYDNFFGVGYLYSPVVSSPE